MFNHVKGDIKKLDYLANFILDYSTPSGVYLKTYQPKGNFSDVENQEHASWQHYAMSYTKNLFNQKIRLFNTRDSRI